MPLVRIGSILIPVLYAGVLAASALIPIGALLIAAAVLAAAIEVLRRLGLSDRGALLLAWAPLHLLILATGSLASPVVPVSAAWVVALGLAWRDSVRWAAPAAALVLVLTATFVGEEGLVVVEAVRVALLLGLAAVVPYLPLRQETPSVRAPAPSRTGGSTREPPADISAESATGLLEVVRLATGADEAAVWHSDAPDAVVEPVAWSSSPGSEAPVAVAGSADHPYRWALAQQQPMHLERGKNPLPRASAAEMLLLPLEGGRGLLSLAFSSAVPPGGEAAAFAAGRALSRLRGLLPPASETHAGPLDALTELPNREAFVARLTTVCALFQRYTRPFGLIILDVDHFKRLNDTWGHVAGDRVLQHVAGVLQNSVREVDFVARFGGEEFAVLLPETGLDQALAVAERVRQSIEEEVLMWNGNQVPVTASFGVAACPETCGVATETLGDAEAALYNSKRSGRNRVSVSAPRS